MFLVCITHSHLEMRVAFFPSTLFQWWLFNRLILPISKEELRAEDCLHSLKEKKILIRCILNYACPLCINSFDLLTHAEVM